MELNSEVRDNIVWIKVSGGMVFDGSLFRLREQVLYGLQTGVRRFVIDISEVSYLDSSGCGEVVRVHTSISRERGSLVFVKPSERIRLLWKHTKLIQVLNVFDTLDEARDFVQGG
jgi:anti-sigma B factor antagonist